jgi:hypothetical protein
MTGLRQIAHGRTPVGKSSLDSGANLATMPEGHDDRDLSSATPMPKAEAKENPPAGSSEGLSLAGFCAHRSEDRSGIGPLINWDGFTGVIRYRPLPGIHT